MTGHQYESITVTNSSNTWLGDTHVNNFYGGEPDDTRYLKVESAPKGQGESELPAGYFVVPYSKNPDFVGRNGILDDLKSGLGHRSLSTQDKGKANARPRLCLYGLGGVGKSQIALAYAYWLKDVRPDISVFWVYSSNADRFRQAYVDIARECKIPGHDSPSVDILSLVKAWLQSKSHDPWLLIIDNADDPDVFFSRAFNGDGSSPPRAEHGRDGKNAALKDFIPQCTCGNGTVLFTTRNKQAGVQLLASLIEVDQMNDQESVEMIRALVGDTQISDEIASGLSERLEKLPLAIAQASAFIQENSMSAGDYLERLDRGDDDIVRLLSEDFRTVGWDDDVPRAVMLTFAISFEQIEREQPLATEILSLIAFFDRQAIPQSLLNDGLAEPWFEDFEYYLSNRAYFDTMKRLKDVGDDENWYNEAEGSLRASNRNGKHRESEDVAEDFNNVRSAGPVDPGDSETDYYLATERDRETLSNSGTSYYNPTCLFSSTQNKESSQARNVTTTPYLRKITPPADYSPRRSIDERDHEFQKAIGKLRAFSIVSQGENKDISVHRLVQLATRHWLEKRGSDGIFAERALRAIAQAFPFPRYAQLWACQSLLPHAKEILKRTKEEILKNKPSDTYNVALLRAILSENLAHFFFDCGRVELRSMARDEGLQATLGEGHPLLTARKVLQAGILTTAGQAQETTKMISRALFLQRQVDPDNLGCILFLKDQLAVALTAERRFKEAINLLTSALRQCEGRHDLRGIRIQLSIRLGWTFKETNELRRAEEILAKTAEEHKANPAPQEHEAEAAHEYKAEHPQMLACSVRLAQVLIMQNKLVEAEQLCLRCLLRDQDVQLNISTRGPLADAKHQLSLSLLWHGRLKDAEESIRQLLQISTDGDNMFVTYKETLCIVLEKQGRWDEAERTRWEVLRLLAGRFERNHPEVLRNRYWLSLAQLKVGKIEEARTLIEETLKRHQRVFGEDDARTRTCLKAVEEMRGASGSNERATGGILYLASKLLGLEIWDLQGTPVLVETIQSISRPCLSPDGRYLATSDFVQVTTITIIDTLHLLPHDKTTEGFRLSKEVDEYLLWSDAKWSPDGSRLGAISSHGKIIVWDFASGQLVPSRLDPLNRLLERNLHHPALSWSANATSLLVAMLIIYCFLSKHGPTVDKYPLELTDDGECEFLYSDRRLCCSLRGSYLAMINHVNGERCEIVTWKWEGRSVRHLWTKDVVVESMPIKLPHCQTFSPDEMWLASLGFDERHYNLMLIDVKSGIVKWKPKFDKSWHPRQIVFDSAGTRIVVGSCDHYRPRVYNETDNETDNEMNDEMEDEMHNEMTNEMEDETDDEMDDAVTSGDDERDDKQHNEREQDNCVFVFSVHDGVRVLHSEPIKEWSTEHARSFSVGFYGSCFSCRRASRLASSATHVRAIQHT